MAQGVKGIPLFKKCCRCNTIKPSGEFYTTKGIRDRLTTYCRKCHTEYRKVQRERYKTALMGTDWKKVSKKCLTCSKILPAVNFNFDFSRVDGLSSHCISCNRIKLGRKTFEEFHVQTDLAEDGEKKCKKCHIVRKVSEFFKNKKRKDGLRQRCKLCEMETQRLRYARVGPEEAEQRRRQVKSNPESFAYWRERVKNKIYRGMDPYVLRKKYFKDPLCKYCGLQFGHPEEAWLDHVIPRSRGGDNAISNIVFTCPPCNRMKGNMNGIEFIEFLKGYSSRLRKKFDAKVVLRCVANKEKCG